MPTSPHLSTLDPSPAYPFRANENGHTLLKDVRKGADLLVVGADKNGGTAKERQAAELGIPLWIVAVQGLPPFLEAAALAGKRRS